MLTRLSLIKPDIFEMLLYMTGTAPLVAYLLSHLPPFSRESKPTTTMRTILLLTTLALLQINPSASRRGALVRDGMSSKISYDNPLLGQSNDLTMDPDAASITSKCPNWAMDPVCLQGVGLSAEEERVCKEVLGQMTKKELHVTFKSARLGGGKRPNWMRATAVLGEYFYLHVVNALMQYVCLAGV